MNLIFNFKRIYVKITYIAYRNINNRRGVIMIKVVVKKMFNNSCKYIRIYDDMVILYSNPISLDFNILNKNYYMVIRDKSIIDNIINDYYLSYKDRLINNYYIDASINEAKEQLTIYNDDKEYSFDINKSDVAREFENKISIKLFTYPIQNDNILDIDELKNILSSKKLLSQSEIEPKISNDLKKLDKKEIFDVDDIIKKIDAKLIETNNKELQDKKNDDLTKEVQKQKLQNAFDSLYKYSSTVKNIDILTAMLKNQFMKNFHIVVEGNDTKEKYKFILNIHNILLHSGKVKGNLVRQSLYNVGAYNTYSLTDVRNTQGADSLGVKYNTYEAIWKTKLHTKITYLIEDIGEFINDYKAIKSNGGSNIKRKQYEHALDILGDIIEENFIIINAKDDELERLFEIAPKLQFIYQNNRYIIPEISLEESYRLYINQIDDRVYDILKQNKDEYRKRYIEYASLNKSFMPFDNRELANYLATYSNLQGDVVFPKNVYKKETVEDALNNIIGLEKIKNKIKDFEKYMLFRVKAEANNIKLDNYNMHMIFTGNPGTGKTTVARIMAKMLYDMGVIKENKLIEVERKDLVAGYVGQTAIKTSEVIEKAIGGVLFIDEAYSLVRDHDAQHGFGNEAIETLIKAMEDRKGKFVAIFAGYKMEMADFVEANPGIASRIGYVFDFPDYTNSELALILDKKIKNSGLKLNADTEEKISKAMNYFARVKNIGNGRFVDKFFQEILLKHAKNDTGDILTITKDDIPTIEEITESLYNGENMINPDEISDKSLRKTAIHEVGHALVRYKLYNSPEIVKITINSEGTGVLGYVQLKANYNEYTSTRSEILNNIMVSLGGMVAEEVVLGEFSNGNSSDLEKATQYAKNMVVKYGMSKLGYGQIDKLEGQIALLVQQEVNDILKECFDDVKKIIIENKDKMMNIVNYLFDKKEINEEQFINIYNE